MTRQEALNILVLKKDFDKSALKKAYRQQALKYHPDKNYDIDSQNRFIEVVEAYEYLSFSNKANLTARKQTSKFSGQKFRSAHHNFRETQDYSTFSQEKKYAYAKKKYEEEESKMFDNNLSEYRNGYKRKLSKIMATIGILLSIIFIADYFLPNSKSAVELSQIEFENTQDPYSKDFFFKIKKQTFHLDRLNYLLIRTNKVRIITTETCIFKEVIKIEFIQNKRKLTTVIDSTSIHYTFPLIIIILLIPFISFFIEKANIYFLLFIVNYNIFVFPIIVLVLLFHDLRIIRMLDTLF